MTCPCPKIGTESECLIDGIFCTIHTAKLEERLQTLTKKAASTSDDLFNSRQIIMKASAIVRTWDVPHQRDRHAAPEMLESLEVLLGLPREAA